MSYPKAYAPEYGYTYQIFTRYKRARCWEHCDYAKDRAELSYLLHEYRLAYGLDYSFKTVTLPRKYHPKTFNAAK